MLRSQRGAVSRCDVPRLGHLVVTVCPSFRQVSITYWWTALHFCTYSCRVNASGSLPSVSSTAPRTAASVPCWFRQSEDALVPFENCQQLLSNPLDLACSASDSGGAGLVMKSVPERARASSSESALLNANNSAVAHQRVELLNQLSCLGGSFGSLVPVRPTHAVWSV